MDDRDEMRELLRSVLDVREWLARLDTKLDYMADVKDTAEEALTLARKVESRTEENSRDIEEIKAEIIRTKEDGKRNWHVLIGMGSSFIVAILIYFLTK
ncbi:holin [Aneurinibacillus aneurinilyticus]|jgi:hypothetical protein|uniref:holin n=1 Tax=Aneurinibacillus aneurinilyticus TaxID=1391 RepID=UPI00366B7B4C